MSPVLIFILGLIAGIVLVLVIVWLIVRVPDSPKQAEPTKPDPRPTLPPFPTDSVPQGDHILVVDDDPEAAEGVALLLRENGYTVEIARSAEDAWVSLRLKLPILIITDDVMPGADGEELMRCIRRSPSREEIPMIRLGELPPRPLDFGFGYGYSLFDLWLTKPFNPEELLSFVRRILQPSNNNSRVQI